MRTHLITKGIISEFEKLNNSTDLDCVLFIDNHKGCLVNSVKENVICELEFFGKNVKCFIFNTEIFNQFNLPLYAVKRNNKSLSQVMWHCADYAFYAVKKYFPNYDFYWQFDYDVFCNGNSYSFFFNKYSCNDKDLLIAKFGEVTLDSKWLWLSTSGWIYEKVKKYHSFFPVSRLSSSAIDFLYKKRLEHKAIFSNISTSKKNGWINCELFVPTELANNGFSCESIDEHLRLEPAYDLNEDRIFENPDFRIYHPVKGNYESKLSLLNEKIRKLEKFRLSLFGYRIFISIQKK